MRKTHKSQGRGQEEEKPWGEGEQTIFGVPRGANRPFATVGHVIDNF